MPTYEHRATLAVTANTIEEAEAAFEAVDCTFIEGGVLVITDVDGRAVEMKNGEPQEAA